MGINRTRLGQAEHAQLEAAGIYIPGTTMVLDRENGDDPYRSNINLAMDAVPTLVTTSNSGIPAYLMNFMDPDILRVLTAKNKAAQIIGEVRKGSWVDATAMFPTVEQTGEVSSYGDWSNNGAAGANVNFPTRENYLFQTVAQWGELQLERAGLAKISYANEVKNAAVAVLEKFRNYTYFYGVAGLQNYGLLNDPGLSSALTPAPKVAGGAKWINAGVMNATANEVYADIQAIIVKLINQSGGNIAADSEMVVAMSPASTTALLITNSFGLNPTAMLKQAYPNLKIESAVQYGALTAQNPQGNAGGELVQVIAATVEGQQSAYAAFSEKLRTHPIIRDLSSFRQKMTAGSWGSVVRQPFAVASMLGV